MDMKVRLMEPGDIAAVAELEKEVFSMPWSSQALRDSLKQNNYLFLVAEAGGQIIGYMGLYWVLDEADITNVAVADRYRRQGIAFALLTEMMYLVRKKGIVLVNLEVRAGNQAAISLYEKMGFYTVGRRKNFYEKPVEDGILMQWKSKEPDCQQIPLN